MQTPPASWRRRGDPDQPRPDTRTRRARHPADCSTPAQPADRRASRLTEAERSLDGALTEAYARIRRTGGDPEAVSIAFAIARDCLAEARELSDRARAELDRAHQERRLAQEERLRAGRDPDTAPGAVIPDAPGTDLYPSPEAVQTPAELVDTLQRYWIWAGQPSYREMARRCGHRFAASTIHSALHDTGLPRLEKIQAIITSCGGSDAHQQAFTTAWRRLTMAPGDARAGAPRPRALYPVREPA